MSKATAESINQIAHRYGHIMNSLHSISGAAGSGAAHANAQPELLTIIHRPGWTTVLDVALANASLDALEQQVNAVEKLHTALTTGARNGLQQAA